MAHPASQGELPPRLQRPFHQHRRSSASRTRCPRRAGRRRRHPGRKFSAQIRTRRIARLACKQPNENAGIPFTEATSITQGYQPHRCWNGPRGTPRARDHFLVTSIELPITPLRIAAMMAQSRRHLSTVPAPLLAVCGPTRWCATGMPAGTAELPRRACAAGIVRAGIICIRRSGGAVTWLARPTRISAAHMPCTSSVAAREGRRGNRQHRYDRFGNCCSSEDRTHSRRSSSSRASISSKHQSLRLDRSVVDHILHVPAVIYPRYVYQPLRIARIRAIFSGDSRVPRGPLPPERHTELAQGPRGVQDGWTGAVSFLLASRQA